MQLEEPWSRVSRGGMVIDGNRRWQLEELKPGYEKAREFLEKEKDQGMELTMERGLERGLERGFGFDRGMGF